MQLRASLLVGHRWPVALMMVVALASMGCAASTGTAASATATTVPTATGAASPTATATPAGTGEFTCPTTTDGSVKVFTDPRTGLSLSYPASWVENQCIGSATPNGSPSLTVGNLFQIAVSPRNGLTIKQWVAATASKNDTVTLTTLTVKHATEADAVSVTIGPNGSPADPYVQTMAIVAGIVDFYQVFILLDVQNETDTVPPLTRAQLVQEVVTTFVVP